MRHTPADSVRPAPESLWQVACDPDRVAALHGLVGDFCHLLRNRLSSLQMGLYLARRDDASAGNPCVWDELDGHYRAAECVVDLFQIICRPMSITPITVGLGLVLNEFAARWSPKYATRGATLVAEIAESDGPSHLDPARLAQGLDALACWRIDRAEPGMRMVLRGWVGQGRSRVEWHESEAPRDDGNGELPLAALARVASVHGGTMIQEDRDGWRVRLDWPHSQSHTQAHSPSHPHLAPVVSA